MKTFFSVLKYVLLLAVALALAWLSLSGVNVSEVWVSIKGANFFILLPTFVLLMVSHWVRALRWNLIIETFAPKPQTWSSFLSLLVGYFANICLPRLGEILRCSTLAKRHRIAMEKLIGTVLVERAFDLGVLLLLTLLAFCLQVEHIRAFFTEQLIPTISRIAWAHAMVVSSVVVAILVGVGWAFRQSRIVQKVREFLRNTWAGVVAIRRLRSKTLFWGYSALIWLCYFFAIYLGCQAIEATKVLGSVASLSILVTGSVGMIVTQGGVGAYPYLVSQTCQWYDILPVFGAALGWLLWSSQVVMTVVAGVFACVYMFIFQPTCPPSSSLHSDEIPPSSAT